MFVVSVRSSNTLMILKVYIQHSGPRIMASILKVDQIGKTSGSTQDTMAGLTKMGNYEWRCFIQRLTHLM